MRLFKGSFFHQHNTLARHLSLANSKGSFFHPYNAFSPKLPLVSAQRFISYWRDTDLPLMPRVAFAHKEIKRFLLENKETIPAELHAPINEQLKIIRKVNWNYYNTNGIDGSKQRKDLEKLLEYLMVLSQMDEHSTLSGSLFSLKSAIECIKTRTEHEFNTFYPKY